MAFYPIINKTTGERKTIEMSVHEITQWYKDNPEWHRDWSEGCANFGEVGEWKDKLIISRIFMYFFVQNIFFFSFYFFVLN